jgi:uncharacterized repeat protein (TIGR02543 family)
MRKKSTLIKNSLPMSKSKSYSKIFNAVTVLALICTLLIPSCKKDTFIAVQGVCPTVLTDPMDGAVDVVLNKVITATFNTPMDAKTINTSTFIIKQGATVIAGTVAPTATANVFTFTPTAPLLPFKVYTGTITTGAMNNLNTGLAVDFNWSFTTIPQIDLSASPTLGGTTDGAGNFAQGSVATVSATPNAGYAFINWTENGTAVSTSANYQFTIAGNRILVANFVLVPIGKFAVVLSSNPPKGGTTDGSGAYTAGSMVVVTAEPNTGYSFTNWTDNGVIVSTSSNYQFILTANRKLVANFTALANSQFAVILSSNPKTGGSTSGSGAYSAGTSVTVNAIPSAGYSFVNWTNKGVIASTSAAYTFPLNANTTLVANFAINQYTITVVAVNGTVTKNPSQAAYSSGATVQLTAVPNAGYTFVSWSGDAISTMNPLTIVVNSNKNITANFQASANAPLFSSIFAVVGGTAGVTNQGINTVINNGAVGTTGVATLITGFHDGLTGDVYTETPLNVGLVTKGIYSAPPFPGTAPKFLIATQALADANAFYISISPANKPGGTDPGAGELGGLTLAPGVYKSAGGSFKITNGDLTLDAQGNPNAVWIFQAPTSLTVGIAGPAGARNVKLTNGALAQNVYWYVGSAATINATGGGTMVGTIITTAGATFSTAGNNVQTVLNGRVISLVASVTLVNTTINMP